MEHKGPEQLIFSSKQWTFNTWHDRRRSSQGVGGSRSGGGRGILRSALDHSRFSSSTSLSPPWLPRLDAEGSRDR
jgi:hypothetical protein